jgi:NAD(P)-dependent dehydrogenase (short-subunit alcohol dehydrogenase family)
MGILEGKTALVFGLSNERSIAWGITQAMHVQGARIGISYAGEALERRVRPLAGSVGCTFVEACDVSKDEDIAVVAAKAGEAFGKIDILIHSIAFAVREELNGPYYNTSREGFRTAMDISVYSFVALARLSAVDASRRGYAVHDLLRRGEGHPTLQRDGRRQVGFGGFDAVPGLQLRAARGARQRHFRRADPHAGGGRRERL